MAHLTVRAPDAARAALDREEGWIAAVTFEELMRDTHGRGWRVVLRDEAAALGLGILGAPPR